MNPEMIWANLAVNDLDRTTKFYTQLGFKPNGAPNNELTSFLVGAHSFVIHFFLKEVLRPAIKGEIADAQTANEIIFTLSAKSRDQVDNWAKEVETAGGKIVSPPEIFGNDYYGFVFADPDGHKFNVFYMEGL
ncbi:VOC family protein [Niabella sp.]|uniref:VOC family protein n=1 Tax=Niabella sp. TaxID=1962976 RepID=UPI00262FFE10|nr:VOC family protein [Niabella sp.]